MMGPMKPMTDKRLKGIENRLDCAKRSLPPSANLPKLGDLQALHECVTEINRLRGSLKDLHEDLNTNIEARCDSEEENAKLREENEGLKSKMEDIQEHEAGLVRELGQLARDRDTWRQKAFDGIVQAEFDELADDNAKLRAFLRELDEEND